MKFFKSKAEKILDSIIGNIAINMSNNYKDNAQSYLKEFDETLKKMKENGEIKDDIAKEYETILLTYQEKMKGYSHKDQKPYWT